MGKIVANAGGIDVIDCETCGFRHIVPLPAPEITERFYRERYYRDEKPDYIAHDEEDLPWLELISADRLELCEKILGPNRRRLIDIGSGPGFFLKTAQSRGWDATGIEPSRQAAAYARKMGTKVVEGFFNADTASHLGRFDVVYACNVLEHVPDPAGFLVLAKEVLTPEGLLCLDVPNDFTAFQAAAVAAENTEKWWIVPHHHYNYFNFSSLTALLRRKDFRVVERSTGFPMELFLLMGENYVGHPELGRACHNKRKRFDLALEAIGAGATRRTFYRALAEAGIGREVFLIATLTNPSPH